MNAIINHHAWVRLAIVIIIVLLLAAPDSCTVMF